MENYNDVYIYLPSENVIVQVCEGDGSNLLPEDRQEGYVDYIYYANYDAGEHFNPNDFNADDFDADEIDGGMVLLTELFQEQFSCTKDAIPNVLDIHYANPDLEYVLL